MTKLPYHHHREECLLWKIEDLSAALIRVQLKLEETNNTCQHLSIQAALTIQNETGMMMMMMMFTYIKYKRGF
jgi:hypothetical protein